MQSQVAISARQHTIRDKGWPYSNDNCENMEKEAMRMHYWDRLASVNESRGDGNRCSGGINK